MLNKLYTLPYVQLKFDHLPQQQMNDKKSQDSSFWSQRLLPPTLFISAVIEIFKIGGLDSSHYRDCSHYNDCSHECTHYDDYGTNDIKNHRTNIASTRHNWRARQHIINVLLSLMAPKNPKLSKGNPLFRCNLCDKEYVNAKGLKSHTKDIHTTEGSQKRSCGLCDKQFASKNILRRHVREKHSDKANCTTEDKYCSVCQKSFLRVTHLNRHLNSVGHLKRIHSSEASTRPPSSSTNVQIEECCQSQAPKVDSSVCFIGAMSPPLTPLPASFPTYYVHWTADLTTPGEVSGSSGILNLPIVEAQEDVARINASQHSSSTVTSENMRGAKQTDVSLPVTVEEQTVQQEQFNCAVEWLHEQLCGSGPLQVVPNSSSHDSSDSLTQYLGPMSPCSIEEVSNPEVIQPRLGHADLDQTPDSRDGWDDLLLSSLIYRQPTLNSPASTTESDDGTIDGLLNLDDSQFLVNKYLEFEQQ